MQLTTWRQAYEAELAGALEAKIVAPLAQSIEVQLRLRYHANGQPPGTAASPDLSALGSMRALLKLPPLRLHTLSISIR